MAPRGHSFSMPTTKAAVNASPAPTVSRTATGIPPRRDHSPFTNSTALIAVAHSIAVTVYNIIKNQTDYVELGADFFDKLNPSRIINRLKNLGFQVQLAPLAA